MRLQTIFNKCPLAQRLVRPGWHWGGSNRTLWIRQPHVSGHSLQTQEHSWIPQGPTFRGWEQRARTWSCFCSPSLGQVISLAQTS